LRWNTDSFSSESSAKERIEEGRGRKEEGGAGGEVGEVGERDEEEEEEGDNNEETEGEKRRRSNSKLGSAVGAPRSVKKRERGGAQI
jgi:hypothetical protein